MNQPWPSTNVSCPRMPASPPTRLDVSPPILPLPFLTLRARSLRAIMGVLHRALLDLRPRTPPSNRTARPTSDGPKKAVDARRPLAKVAPLSVAVANFMAALPCVIASRGAVWVERHRGRCSPSRYVLRADALRMLLADHDH